MRFARITVICLVILFAVSCSRDGLGGMRVEKPWVRSTETASDGNTMGHDGMASITSTAGENRPSSASTSAAYMIIYNETGSNDRLVKVESDIAEVVEMHQTQIENDIMSMRPVAAIDIPTGGEAILEPGGFHIMLVGLKQSLIPGTHVQLTL